MLERIFGKKQGRNIPAIFNVGVSNLLLLEQESHPNTESQDSGNPRYSPLSEYHPKQEMPLLREVHLLQKGTREKWVEVRQNGLLVPTDSPNKELFSIKADLIYRQEGETLVPHEIVPHGRAGSFMVESVKNRGQDQYFMKEVSDNYSDGERCPPIHRYKK